MKTMQKTNKRKTIRRVTSLVLALSIGCAMIQKPQNAFAADGGNILSEAELSSDKLVNPNRDYVYRYHSKDVLSVKNVDGIYDYVVMPDLPGQDMGGTDHLKYLVIHETDNTAPTATAIANYSSFWQSENNSTWIIDDNTVVQGTGMNVRARTIGNTDFDKSDISNGNSVNIEIAVNSGGDYMRSVANTVHFVRTVLAEYPLELARHYDAFSERDSRTGESYHKMCPQIMLSETTWWTWDRFVCFATNPELPIPFIDFNPNNANDIPKELKGLDIMKDNSENADNNQNVETDKTSEDIIAKNDNSDNEVVNTEHVVEEDVVKIEEVVKNEEPNMLSEADTIVEKNEKEAAIDDSLFVFDSKVNKDDFLVFNEYIDLNIEEMKSYIQEASQGVAYTDSELHDILVDINFACKMETFNPYIAVEMMNQYTGFLHFGGQAKPEYYNFGGLVDKKGDLIQYKNIKEGAIAYIQFLKYLTSKDKLKLSCNNDKAVEAIKSRGKVKNLGDMTRALGVSQSFISSIVNRVQDLT